MKCGMSVCYKKNKKWIWLAIDADSREIVGVFIGEREALIGKATLAILACCLPLLAPSVIPTFGKHMSRYCRANDRRAVGKETGKTNYPGGATKYPETLI